MENDNNKEFQAFQQFLDKQRLQNQGRNTSSIYSQEAKNAELSISLLKQKKDIQKEMTELLEKQAELSNTEDTKSVEELKNKYNQLKDTLEDVEKSSKEMQKHFSDIGESASHIYSVNKRIKERNEYEDQFVKKLKSATSEYEAQHMVCVNAKKDVVELQEEYDGLSKIYSGDDLVEARKKVGEKLKTAQDKYNSEMNKSYELKGNVKSADKDLENAKKQIEEIENYEPDKSVNEAFGNMIKSYFKSDEEDEDHTFETIGRVVGGVIGEAIAPGIGAEVGAQVGAVVGKLADNFSNIVGKLVDSVQSTLDKWLDTTTSTLAGTYGQINAALEGTSTTFSSLQQSFEDSAGLSGTLKQTDYLNQIANLTSQGITADLESKATLQALASKTVSAFNATDSNLTRLVKLNQQRGNLTAKQFGLMAALKESFNETFKDTSYLNDLYSTITGSVLDAVSANAQNSGGTDSSGFYSVLQSWLGAMYESGMDSSTVQKIATGINYLGSGNVSALASQSDIQTLLLLSMDRIGMDYAEVLQQGLDATSLNSLLYSIVDYLADITDNTKSNNVLESAYGNLFNLSMTDLNAIKNLKNSNFSASYYDGAKLLNIASTEVEKASSSSRTIISEKIDNVIDNIAFTWGSNIAESSTKYLLYKGSEMIMNLTDSLVGEDGSTGSSALDTGLKFVKLAALGTYFGTAMSGALDVVQALSTSVTNVLTDTNGLAELVQSDANGGWYDGTNSTSTAITRTGASTQLKAFKQGNTKTKDSITASDDWFDPESEANQQVDESLEILKEIEKALMKDGDNYALAVSLQGMSDAVLRSFASIFADENALKNEFEAEGKNNVFKNMKFISYDTSSKTSNKTSTTKSTNATSTATKTT